MKLRSSTSWEGRGDVADGYSRAQSQEGRDRQKRTGLERQHWLETSGLNNYIPTQRYDEKAVMRK